MSLKLTKNEPKVDLRWTFKIGVKWTSNDPQIVRIWTQNSPKMHPKSQGNSNGKVSYDSNCTQNQPKIGKNLLFRVKKLFGWRHGNNIILFFSCCVRSSQENGPFIQTGNCNKPRTKLARWCIHIHTWKSYGKTTGKKEIPIIFAFWSYFKLNSYLILTQFRLDLVYFWLMLWPFSAQIWLNSCLVLIQVLAIFCSILI